MRQKPTRQKRSILVLGEQPQELTEEDAERLTRKAAGYAEELLLKYRRRPGLEHLDIALVATGRRRKGRKTDEDLARGIYANLWQEPLPLEIWEPVVKRSSRNDAWTLISSPEMARDVAERQLESWAIKARENGPLS